MYFSTKSFFDYPCCHRQHKHEGHCRHLHGYSRSFYFKFVSDSLDDKGWVWDFSDCKFIKKYLDEMFDHTVLINEDDDHLDSFRDLHERDLLKLVILENVSMEGTAKHLWEWVNRELHWRVNSKVDFNRRVRCWHVEVRENNKKSGIFEEEPYRIFSHQKDDFKSEGGI